jgi:Domain of unknown function (DUF4350)
MPLNLDAGDRRLLVASTTVFVLSAVLAVFLSPSESDAKYATSYSAASEGAKATYLLLRESGYRAERWTRPPAELSDARNTLLIIADPSDIPAQADKSALEKFLRNGGELVLAGGLTPVFVSDVGPTRLPVPMGPVKFAAQTPSPQGVNAPEIELDTVASWIKPGPGIGLYGDAAQYTVMQYAHGSGTVLWLASSSLLSNAGLRQSGNLEFLLSTIGSKSRRVLWDEYFHGHRTTATAAMAHPQLSWLFGQLGLIAVAVLLTFSRRSGPRRAPRPESRLSPLEYVRALGNLYEHARAANIAVDVAYERFRYVLTKRLGLGPSASRDELTRAVAERWAIDREDLRALLEACESARFFEDLSEREALDLVQRVYKYSALLKLVPELKEEER